MRQQTLIPALLLALTPCVCSTVKAQPKHNAETHAILRIEDQWLHAKSAQEAARFLAPDFVGISTHGIIETRDQRLARFRPAPEPPATEVHFEHLTVAFPAPSVAIATGQVVATGSDDRRIYVVAFTDTFCLRHGQWLAVHAQETLAFPAAG